MNTESKRELFETMPVKKALATMAVPTIISQLINLVYNMVDAFFIGRTGNSYQMAAVTLAFTIFMMTIAFSDLFGVGGGSLIARLIGRHDEGSAKKVCAFSFYGAICIALTYSLLIAAFMNPVLRLLGASDKTIGFARQYVWLVVVAGNVPVILSNVMSHMLRNVGYSKQASLGLSGGGVLNIALDPLFMFVLMPKGYEVLGAALATLISNLAGCLYLLIVTNRVAKSSALCLRLSEVKGISRKHIHELFSVGVPAAILTGLFDLANIFLNALMAVHGDLELAALGIVMKAERLPNAIGIGLSQAMLPIVAYNYASGDHKRMRSTIRTARSFGLCVSVICLVLFQIFATPITKLFMSTSNGNVEQSLVTIGFAVTFLRLRCVASASQFLNYHSSFCMQAMGYGKGTFMHAIVRELVFYIPLMYLLNFWFGKYGLVSALLAGETLGAIFALILLTRRVRKGNSNLKKA